MSRERVKGSRWFAALLAGGACLVGWNAPAGASVVVDAVGDFLPSYTAGAKNGDLDVVSAGVTLGDQGTKLRFVGNLAGPIGTTPGAFYVWGLDRGKGTERFLAGNPPIGAGVLFDSVVILRPNHTGNFNDLLSAANSKAIPPADIVITGNTISADLPLSLFTAPAPPAGLDPPDQWTWNLWPRLGAGQNPQISDFAPDASNASVVPEPGTLFLLVSGLGGLGAVTWRRGRHLQPRSR